ncbi:MAG TPA: DUF86 domain-containing protein [Candidatus Nanoarchaeia archaeon]|nr:DUF86 domain-containing protein [Candidatus Nanoarchaeia archaeon]
MSGKIKDKINEIQKYLEELGSFSPIDFGEYEQNVEKKAACERYFEKIIEAVVDLTFLLLKNKNLKIPEEDKEAFNVLVKEKIISVELAERLKDAKGMRNILAHEYGIVDDTIVFESITEELEKDVRLLLERIEEYLKSNE